MKTSKFKTVDEYTASVRDEEKEQFIMLLDAVRRSAPQAQESISYGMPVFKQKGVLVYIGAFRGHVSLFPGPIAVDSFVTELAGYETSRGTIRFTPDSPLPVELIMKIVRFCIERNEHNARIKKSDKSGLSM